MRSIPTLFISFFLFVSTVWQTDFEDARKQAEKEHKLLLLNFSGSDWCGPCIRLHKDVFETPTFEFFAANNLVLVNADFPRMKKNQLSKEQQKKNDKLADKYNSQGIFPFTLLLNEKGKVLKSWEGYPDLTPEEFLLQIKTAIDASN